MKYSVSSIRTNLIQQTKESCNDCNGPNCMSLINSINSCVCMCMCVREREKPQHPRLMSCFVTKESFVEGADLKKRHGMKVT